MANLVAHLNKVDAGERSSFVRKRSAAEAGLLQIGSQGADDCLSASHSESLATSISYL